MDNIDLKTTRKLFLTTLDFNWDEDYETLCRRHHIFRRNKEIV